MKFGLKWSDSDSLMSFVLNNLFSVCELDWDKVKWYFSWLWVWWQCYEGTNKMDKPWFHWVQLSWNQAVVWWVGTSRKPQTIQLQSGCPFSQIALLDFSYYNDYCSASAKYSMFFNLTYGDANIFFPIYITMKLPPTIARC